MSTDFLKFILAQILSAEASHYHVIGVPNFICGFTLGWLDNKEIRFLCFKINSLKLTKHNPLAKDYFIMSDWMI
jgi:hypothetical protein